MNAFCFYISTLDQTTMVRWLAAFKKEGWEASNYASTKSGTEVRTYAELDLVEVGNPLCRTPEDLRDLIASRHPAATLAFATRHNISNSQIIKFLESGADDFMFSDIDERVVVAKLKAYVRRMQPAIKTAAAKLTSSKGDLLIDRDNRLVRVKITAGKYSEIPQLTEKEVEILTLLVGKEKHAVSRENILERLWGEGATKVYSNCINKHIETLRKKMGPYGKRIKTVYGSGYMFV